MRATTSSGASASGVAAVLAALGRAPGGILRGPKKEARPIVAAAPEGTGLVNRLTRRTTAPSALILHSTMEGAAGGGGGGGGGDGRLSEDISADGMSAEDENEGDVVDYKDGTRTIGVALTLPTLSQAPTPPQQQTLPRTVSGEIPSLSDIAVPPRPADMKILQETTLECSVDEFFALGWSDSARVRFNAECHRSRGETRWGGGSRDGKRRCKWEQSA